MNQFFLYGFAALLLMAAGSCKKEAITEPDTCVPTSAVVKSVTAREGRVEFDRQVNQYVVVVSLPTATGAQDIGVLCTPLPAELQVKGLPVLFLHLSTQ
jgi:tagatose-1,6-bisphosphate aldolase non-catalytic subunit AgaZ/GatZ